MDRSLDIADPQVLVHFPADAGGFYHHHRVLLARGGAAGVWVTLTPDLEYAVHNLSTERHLVLGRNELFDPGLAAQVYCFDPITKVQLADFMRRAKLQAHILAEPGVEDLEVDSMVWLVAGPGLDKLGTEIDDAICDDAARFRDLGPRGVAELDGSVWCVERVARADKERWIKEHQSAERDDRLLGVHLRNGKRFLPLRDALGISERRDYPDWGFTGPRVCLEYLTAIDEAGGFISYEDQWVRKSGVHCGSSQAQEHRTGSETLRLLVELDQCDPVNLAAAENLCRRQVQLELAIERNPTHPDFTGLEEIMGRPISDKGSAVTSKFREWVASKQKDRATILKQSRLEKEEKAAVDKRVVRDGGGGGGGVGQPKAKAKGKGGGSGGSSSPAPAQ